jgi:hypothetical protein
MKQSPNVTRALGLADDAEPEQGQEALSRGHAYHKRICMSIRKRTDAAWPCGLAKRVP